MLILSAGQHITPGLESLDILKAQDRAMLTVYVETWATYVQAVACAPTG